MVPKIYMSKEKDCVFCREYNNDDMCIFYKNKYFFARYDKFPVSPGHTEIMPLRHIDSLDKLTQEEWNALFSTIKTVKKKIGEDNVSGKLEEYYKSQIGDPVNEKSKYLCQNMGLEHIGLGKLPDGENHGINKGFAAGQSIFHLHWHIIPRYKGDVENPRGGVRNTIPGFGDY